ncbi:GDNF-inducible zinc finger protein 1-like [Cylas formicarius]|uniref:GDNF-inducible zinc finger protein 1-like n=1 Tax=Cylas formicarius TaxID=197179 RepID=UPI0029589D23|nr:GDNF-inducible zinc finger protein 1-like [Cylas formicarius]
MALHAAVSALDQREYWSDAYPTLTLSTVNDNAVDEIILRDHADYTKTVWKFNNNNNVVREIREFVCHTCDKKYCSSGALQRHLRFECRIDSKYKCPLADYYKCFVCGKTYKVQRSLWRHLKYECQKEPAFNCPYCSYRAKHKSSVVKHAVCVHGGCTARHFCPRCGKSYTLVKNLKRHLSVECQKEKRFKCRFCSNSYYYRTDLRNHLHRVHDVIVRFDAGAVYL